MQLTVRDHRDAPRRVIPRERWQFAREEAGNPVPSRAHVFMPSGFEAGKIYEVVYLSENPVVVGLGLAAVRDFVCSSKYGSAAVQAPAPAANWDTAPAKQIGFGVVAERPVPADFLYLGFNQDERARPAFDGVWAHVAGGGLGSFNHRFAQPSRDARPFFNFFYPTDIFPFSDREQTESPRPGVLRDS